MRAQRRIRFLKLDAQRKLHAAHRSVGCQISDLSAVAAIDAAGGIPQIRVVEDVVDLRAELRVDLFTDRERLEDG